MIKYMDNKINNFKFTFPDNFFIEQQKLEKKEILYFLKEVYKINDGKLNWTENTVSEWCNMANHGFIPMVNTHIIQFQIYRDWINKEIFRFEYDEYVKVLIIGAAESPYLALYADSLLNNDGGFMYNIVAFDPMNHIVEKYVEEFAKMKPVILKNCKTSSKKEYIWSDERGQILLLEDDCLVTKTQFAEYRDRDIVILPTCIFEKGEDKLYFEYICDLLSCLKPYGIFIMQIDIRDACTDFLNKLIECMHLLNGRLVTKPIVFTGMKDSVYKNRNIFGIAEEIPIPLEYGANQIIFLWEFSNIHLEHVEQAEILFQAFFEGYY